MPKTELVVTLSDPQRWLGLPKSIDLRIYTSKPWMSRPTHGFLNVGAVACCKVAAEEMSKYLSTGRVTY